jgi:hypothetical protein
LFSVHLHPIPRFLVRTLIRGVLVLLFIGLPAAILYLREAGVGFGMKERLAEALSGAEFQTTIGKLTFDPFTGLIADRVEINSRKPPGGNLAKIERLVVSAKLSDLAARKVTVDTIDHIQLDDTDISVPIDSEPGSPRLKLNGVSAQLLFSANQMRISYFEGNIQGVRVVLSGLLLNPQSFKAAEGGGGPAGPPHRAALADWLERFSSLNFASPPELRAEINGDLSDRTTIDVRPISLRSGPISGPNWRIEGVEVDAEYHDGGLSIGKILVRGKEGELNATADLRDQRVSFDVMSSLGLEPFRGLLPKDSPARQLKFTEAPLVQASGSISLAPAPAKVEVIGSAELGKFSFKGVKFDSFRADFAVRDGRFFSRGARLAADGGEFEADVLYEPNSFRVRFENTIRPTYIAPLLGEKEQEFLVNMEFRDAPFVQFEMRGTKPDFASIKGAGTLKLGRTAVRGAWMDRIESKFEIADSAFNYRNFTIARGKGTATGTFIYDIGRREVRLEGVKSTLPPVDVLMWVDPKIADAVRAYRFRQNPLVLANGMVHLKDADKNNLSLKVDSDGLDYDLLNRTLKFGDTLADIDIKGKRVLANVKSAKLMGGDTSIRANVSIDDKDPVFSADLDVRKVDFAKLTKLYFDYDDSAGAMSGKFKFTARMKEEEKMRGSGSIRVEDGHVFAIPLLGPLSDIINKIIPKAGYQTARLATADFRMGDEKISTDNLVIEGSGFSLFGSGDIYFMRDRMDMSVRINARGIPGIVLFPVSKLLEYVSTGSVSNPEWKPKIIPRFGNGEQKATP